MSTTGPLNHTPPVTHDGPSVRSCALFLNARHRAASVESTESELGAVADSAGSLVTLTLAQSGHGTPSGCSTRTHESGTPEGSSEIRETVPSKPLAAMWNSFITSLR